MDRKNRVKMLINKLWKTLQIQAAFGMQVFFVDRSAGCLKPNG